MPTSGRFLVDPDDPRPLYVQIMDEVRRSIVSGSLGADDPLPSVRELSGELRLNPNTVQQAYRELEREGVVYVRRGQGTFVSPGVAPSALHARVVRDFSERVLREAARSGISPSELLDAIRDAESRRTPPEGEEV